jgi:hypothetical protein
VFYDTASVLFGVAGLRVTDAGAGLDGVVEVWAVTDSRARQRARTAGVSWPVAHDAFAARADTLLNGPLAPVAHLGSTSTGAAAPGGSGTRRPGSTRRSRTGGT